MTQTTTQRLERPLAGRKIAGVCAGIARHQRVDVTIVRVATLVLMALGGIGFIAYFVGLLLIPAEGSPEPIVREGIGGPERKYVIVFGIAATIALFGLGVGPFGGGFLDGTPWTLIAIAAIVGAVIVVVRETDQLSASSPPATAAPAATAITAQLPRDGGQTTAVGETPTVVQDAVTPPEPERRRGHGALILGGTLLAIAVAGGILAASGDGVRWDVALCSIVIAIGAVLVIASPFGGARILAPFGLMFAILAGTAAAADLKLRGGVGDHLAHPVALNAAKDNNYDLAAGRLMVDLRDVTLAPGITTVKAEVGFGQLVVRIPAGVRVRLSAHASAGDIGMLGRDANGLDADRSETVNPLANGPILQIKAHAGFGQVRILNAGDRLPPLGDHATITTGDSR